MYSKDNSLSNRKSSINSIQFSDVKATSILNSFDKNKISLTSKKSNNTKKTLSEKVIYKIENSLKEMEEKYKEEI